MRRDFFKKFLGVVCLVSVLSGTVFLPILNAQAQWVVHDPKHTIMQSIWNGIKIAAQQVGNLSLGLPGSGAAAGAVVRNGERACEVLDKTLKVASLADNFGSAEAIAGSAAKISALNAKIVALQTIVNCYKTVLAGVKDANSTGAGATGSQVLQQFGNNIIALSNAIGLYEQRIERLKELKNEAYKELWKAVAVRTLMRVQLRITTNLVNQLVAKYKISNILKYADAAATQVYMIDYINKNVPDGKDQAILRSIFANQGLHDTVYPMIRAKIEQQIQKAPGDLMITSGDFYDELNQYGSPDYNAAYVSMTYQNTLDYAKARAAEYALEEIQTSQGFLPVRNCTDIMVFQRQYDQDNARLSYEVRVEEENVLKLMSADMNSKVTGGAGVDPNEIKIARAKLNEAQKALQEFGKTQKAFTPPCGPIVNPGYSIAQSINSYLSSQLGSAANLKTENLPFFATFAESVASNFLTKIVTTGVRSANNLLKEDGYESSSISPAAVIEDRGEANVFKTADSQTEKGITSFTGERTDNASANEFLLTWNAQPVPGASYVIITGPNRFSVRQTSLNGQLRVSAAAGGVYTLTVYDSKNLVLETATFEMPTTVTPAPINTSGIPDDATDADNVTQTVGDQVNTGPPIENTTVPDQPLIWPNPNDNSPFTYNSGNNKGGLVAGVSIKRPSEPPRGYKTEQLR